MNIFEYIKQETSQCQDRPAIIEGDKSISYRDLIETSGRIASALSGQGMRACHRVGIVSDDCIDYVSISLAVLSLSAVVVPIASEQTQHEIEEIIEKIGVDYLIFNKGNYRDDVQPSAVYAEGMISQDYFISKRQFAGVSPEGFCRLNPAFIRFSSGTTGASKGVVLSHESILARTTAADRGLKVTSSDTIAWVLSMSFHFVVTILLFLRRGATIVLCGKRFPESLIEMILKHKPTLIYASPFHYRMLTQIEELDPSSLDSVRLAVSTAIRLPDEVAKGFRDKFGFELAQAYGIIEVGLPFIRFPDDVCESGSVGRALPDYEIKIANPDAEGVGEIYLRGKGMLDAYYSPWREAGEILDDGWFWTGDVGRVDASGFLSIVGRAKDVINFAGMKIFASEVEEVLCQHPSVGEALVYGEAHPHYGELPVAKIVLRDGAGELDVAELRRFCYKTLAQYKVPKAYEIVRQLARTASGKVKR